MTLVSSMGTICLCESRTTLAAPSLIVQWTSVSTSIGWVYDSFLFLLNVYLSVPDCPALLKGPLNPHGTAVGCLSACTAKLDGNQQDSPNCCSGSHDTPATCPPSGVAFYSYFKDRCPNSYVYAYDVGHYASSRNHRLIIARITGILRNCSLDLPSVEIRQLRSDFLPVAGLI